VRCGRPCIGHDSRKYPVTDNWPNLVQQLADFVRAEINKPMCEPRFSWSGTHWAASLSLMCAAHHPELARGVLMIDSPVLGRLESHHAGLDAKRTAAWSARLSPGRISQKRPAGPLAQSAMRRSRNFQQGKKAFAASGTRKCWRNYIDHGTHDEEGERVLQFQPRGGNRHLQQPARTNSGQPAAAATHSNARQPSLAAPARQEMRQAGMPS
jgi:pimeloyl-ACP methyl ester carboxylesterase